MLRSLPKRNKQLSLGEPSGRDISSRGQRASSYRRRETICRILAVPKDAKADAWNNAFNEIGRRCVEFDFVEGEKLKSCLLRRPRRREFEGFDGRIIIKIRMVNRFDSDDGISLIRVTCGPSTTATASTPRSNASQAATTPAAKLETSTFTGGLFDSGANISCNTGATRLA